MTRSEAFELAFDYDMDTGLFRWKIGHRGLAGSAPKNHGYIYLHYNGHYALAHHAAWFLTFGSWPKEIDHKNRIRADNRIANLRLATRSQNKVNSFRADNVTGYTGVQKRSNGTWRAYISKDFQWIHIGTFKTFDEAKAARIKVERELYGEFANA